MVAMAAGCTSCARRPEALSARTATAAIVETRIGALLEDDGRPAVGSPADGRDPQRRHALILRIIGVIDEVVALAVAQHRLAARSLEPLLAVGPEERPQHVLRPAGDDVVGALVAAAAEIERDEQVIVSVMLGHVRRL